MEECRMEKDNRKSINEVPLYYLWAWRTLQVNIILVCYCEDIISFVGFHRFDEISSRIFEVDFKPEERSKASKSHTG